MEYTDMYRDLGVPYPDVDTICKGRCEGTGWVPVHKDDPNDDEGNWRDLWLEAEEKELTYTNYHFVKCPTCNGTGKI